MMGPASGDAMGAVTLGFVETVRTGFRGAWPEDCHPRVLRALRLVRLSAYLMPLASLLASAGLWLLAESAADSLTDALGSLGILGVFLGLAFLPLILLVVVARALALLLLALALPLALVPAWSLGRLLDPGEPPMDLPLLVLALVGVPSLAVSVLLVFSVVGAVLVPLTLLPFLGWWLLRRALRALDEAPQDADVAPTDA